MSKAPSLMTSRAQKHANKLLVAIDWESAGDLFDEPLLAAGVVVGDGNGVVFSKTTFCRTVPPPEQFNQRTWTEFFMQTPTEKNGMFDGQALLRHINDEAQFADSEALVRGVYQHILDSVAQFGDGRELVLLSDNPLFDLGKFDAMLLKYGISKAPLRHSFKGGYVKVFDPSEQLHGMLDIEKPMVKALITAEHSHWPSEDALHIYQQQLAIWAVIGQRVRAFEYMRAFFT